MKKLKTNQAGVGLGNATQYLIETGTWTPIIRANNTVADVTYTYNNGFYTRIGNWVTVHCTLLLSDNGTSSGDMNITGLPFAVDHESDTNYLEFAGTVGWGNPPLPLATYVSLYAVFDSLTYPGVDYDNGTGTIWMLYNEGITGDQGINVNTLPNNFYTTVSGSYRCVL